MPEASLDIPRYDVAMKRFIHQVVDGFVALDPLLGAMPRQPILHAGPTRNVRGDTPLDQRMSEIRGEATLDMDAIRNTDTEEYAAFLYELGHSTISSHKAEFFERATEVADAVGNTIDAAGKPFSFDQFLDLIERMHIGFDDEGEPIMPTLLASPELCDSLKRLEDTPEQQRRLADVLARKKTEYYAKKRTRRLSR